MDVCEVPQDAYMQHGTCDGISEENTLRARKLRISNKRLYGSPDSRRGGHSCGQVIRVALVVVVMIVMMVVGRHGRSPASPPRSHRRRR